MADFYYFCIDEVKEQYKAAKTEYDLVAPLYKENIYIFFLDNFFIFFKKFTESFHFLPSNDFIQNFFFTGSPFFNNKGEGDPIINYFYIDIFNEFFRNYFLVRDSFFFDSILAIKFNYFLNPLLHYKEEVFFHHFSDMMNLYSKEVEQGDRECWYMVLPTKEKTDYLDFFSKIHNTIF